MTATDLQGISSARYSGDAERFAAIRSDKVLEEQQRQADLLASRSRARLHFLATSVRVSGGLLPEIDQSVARLAQRVQLGKPLEVFVTENGSINAFVMESRSRFLVCLNSAAVTTLSAGELEFVIGHELGHALFGHTELSTGHLLELSGISDAQSKLLCAWQRAAEISADRVGFLCCGSLEVAATALVKLLAGLPLPGVSIRPADITGQWESLLEELLDDGAGDLWQQSHPFPPLRIKALDAFARRQREASYDADAEVRRLLSVMDSPGVRGPVAGEEGLLARFLLWGGLYVGMAEGTLSQAAAGRLAALSVPGTDLAAILSGREPSSVALENFRAAKASRRTKLKAAELSGLMHQLVEYAALDQKVSPAERERLAVLAGELGLGQQAVAILIEQHERRGA